MARPAVPIFAALVAALGLAACGGGGGSDKGDVESIIKLVANSDEKACDKLTGALVKREFGGSKDQCVKQAKASSTKVKYDVKSVDVKGDKATATVGAQGQTQTLQFVKDGGDWKLDQIGQSSQSK